MFHSNGWIRKAVLVGVLALCLPGWPLLAAPNPQVPCNPPFPCMPNAKNWGYFETRWREWPCEYRPDKQLPRALGAEITPTPAGREPIPPPQAVPLPSKPPGLGEPVEPAPVAPSESSIPTVPRRELVPSIKEPETPRTPPAPEPPLQPSPPSPFPSSGATVLPPEPRLIPSVKPIVPDLDTPLERPKDFVPDAPSKPAMPEPQSPSVPRSLDNGGLRLPALDDQPKQARVQRPSGGKAAQPLQAAWGEALYPESLSHGNLQSAAYQDEVPAKEPPVALGGYCPVELGDRERWVAGDKRHRLVHNGQTYLFAGPAQKQRFQAASDRYVPAHSGNDPVLIVEQARQVPGRLEHSATYNGRLYFFSSQESLRRFARIRATIRRQSGSGRQPVYCP